MKSRKAVEETIRTKLNHTLDSPMRDRLLAHALREQEQSQETTPALNQPATRRMIMKNRIVKLGIAAAIIAVTGLGIVEFLGTGKTSGVAWGEVAKKVEASRGVVFRVRTTASPNPNKDWPNECATTRRSPKYSRTDWVRDGRPSRMVSFNLDAKTMLWLDHDRKAYFTRPMDEKDSQSLQSEWSDPKALLDLFMSRGYRELGRKTIDGVVCEGIETTDPVAAKVNFPVKSLSARLWASVETGYPVLGEIEVVRADNSQRQTSTADQFQWDVEIGLSEIDVAVPPDYQLID
jgi:hypothetical protein